MLSPAPASAPVVASSAAVTRMVDPDHVREVFSNEVSFQVRDGAMQLTFCSIRPTGIDANGAATLERVIVARIAVSLHVANLMIGALRQMADAVRLNAAVPGTEAGAQGN